MYGRGKGATIQPTNSSICVHTHRWVMGPSSGARRKLGPRLGLHFLSYLDLGLCVTSVVAARVDCGAFPSEPCPTDVPHHGVGITLAGTGLKILQQ